MAGDVLRGKIARTPKKNLKSGPKAVNTAKGEVWEAGCGKKLCKECGRKRNFSVCSDNKKMTLTSPPNSAPHTHILSGSLLIIERSLPTLSFRVTPKRPRLFLQVKECKIVMVSVPPSVKYPFPIKSCVIGNSKLFCSILLSLFHLQGTRQRGDHL